MSASCVTRRSSQWSDLNRSMLELYGKACGWALARAHGRASHPWLITGYLGNSDAFDKAMGDFAVAYADQAERDHAALKAAVSAGTITVYHRGRQVDGILGAVLWGGVRDHVRFGPVSDEPLDVADVWNRAGSRQRRRTTLWVALVTPRRRRWRAARPNPTFQL